MNKSVFLFWYCICLSTFSSNVYTQKGETHLIMQLLEEVDFLLQ